MKNHLFRTCFSLATVLVAAASSCPAALAQDWPTYQRDSARSGSTPESPPDRLEARWTYRSNYAPRPAWPGPAKWDGYNKVYDLADRMRFDVAFQVAAVGERVYLGSSVDDKIYCLDASNGERVWSAFTEGPVRLSPTVAAGKVYAGSDDGCAYCFDASNGKQIFKTRIAPRDKRVPGNGRLISLWPVRAGMVVEDNVLYCAAGVFPWEGVYIAAVDAGTGEVMWRTELSDLPAQGYLLASPSKLYLPTGRSRPVVFDRQSGERLYEVGGGGGGTFALLTGDSLIYGPGKTGQMSMFGEGVRDQLASFDGNHMIVTAGMSYLHSDKSLAGLNRALYLKLLAERREVAATRGELKKELATLETALKAQAAADVANGGGPSEDSAPVDAARMAELREELTRLSTVLDDKSAQMKDCTLWQVQCSHPYSMIQAGSTLILGGENSVAGVSTESGETLWTLPATGRIHGLAFARGRLYASSDLGTVHCFAGPR